MIPTQKALAEARTPYASAFYIIYLRPDRLPEGKSPTVAGNYPPIYTGRAIEIFHWQKNNQV